MILYHYTSKASFDDIMRTKKINASDPLTTMDAAYGQGWYFTDLEPDKCDAWTVAYCWRSLSVFEKVEAFLKFDVPSDMVKSCREHVYMIAKWDDRITYLEGKPTPKCNKGPCNLCAVISNIKKFFGWT